MAKTVKSPKTRKTPAARSGASPAKVKDPKSMTIQAPPAEQDPTAPSSPKGNTYHVNWHFQGFRATDLFAGDTVEATEEEAAPFCGPDGVLTLAEA